uniref:Uncharacterized protein n=1 Tax=Chromera velia CCMP2878 TaxID=1169474 RepID=A0A0G4FC71_9ALVE|eukprot:Cvel_16139.t1-p1 / transcript=Cvel_16139.t1 / gene=Cvel_16139 / organism=Chromera_velia_CCMP2878 / gene_product=Trifunctional purine biosynthetic protein, putative / transcript_product=Trifunctional purine biosynthetic protein, putative / location=Cvel_scaffold1229:3057-17517(+) / protein_length=1814 / sequence_SO=supercontig / SO=protein_coding / is_pseudo=false
MGEEIGHHCGVAMVRLMKPLDYYIEKYGTAFFGLKSLYLLLEKQRNRGQDGSGIASLKFDMEPGHTFLDVMKSVAADPIKDVMFKCETAAQNKLEELTADEKKNWRMLKHRVPFTGECFLGHVRYGTDSDNSEVRCHPVVHENNWMSRYLALAANFNLTNVDELFDELVHLGQHPREKSDTITVLENVSHFLDKENNDLYVKYYTAGHEMRSCFRLVGEHMNVARILRQAAAHWDGGYLMCGMIGHGDCFAFRDPAGIRPGFYFVNDEFVAIASEKPVIQSVFKLTEADEVRDIPPGHAMIIKKDGSLLLEKVLEPAPPKPCSFERIYFSRGGDSEIYRERERLGRVVAREVMKAIDGDLENTVVGFIPNTAELAYYGLVKGLEDELDKMKKDRIMKLGSNPKPEDVAKILSMRLRAEKVTMKDAKIRTFIQEDSGREFLVSHAYDICYDTVRPTDNLVVIDDSIVRGTTLTNSILTNLDRLCPKRIVVVSSAPQIRFPDCYGIDIAKIKALCAFKAAVKLHKERGEKGETFLRDLYNRCREVVKLHTRSGDPRLKTNVVKELYKDWEYSQVTDKICEILKPKDLKAEVKIVFQTIEGLHEAIPVHNGDWYFTGDYPTPGGMKVAARAYMNFFEGSDERGYGVQTQFGKTVLVLGSGGREHSIAWRLAHSQKVGQVFVAPGNGGTAHIQIGQRTVKNAENLKLDSKTGFKDLLDFCKQNGVGLVVVGGETLLAEGVADVLSSKGIPVFGPSKAAAQLETSKAFSKDFMERHNIPTAKYKTFSGGAADLPAALAFAKSLQFQVVVKASGLCAGKGVLVPASSPEDVEAALKTVMADKAFGEGACSSVVVEEKLEGPEVSLMAFTDGQTIVPMPPATDHKRLLENDEGPNTGGMGAYAPSPLLNDDQVATLKETVLEAAVKGMAAEGAPFKGVLYAGLMLTFDGPKVLEFNCRLGDPEAQCVLPLIDSDLYEICMACTQGNLEDASVSFLKASCCCVVMASGGYPGAFQKGYEISGIKNAEAVPGVRVFQAGTRRRPALVPAQKVSRAASGALDALSSQERSKEVDGAAVVGTGWRAVETNGGRVLGVAAVAKTLQEAQSRAYVGVRTIDFLGCHYRRDIGMQVFRSASVDAFWPGSMDSAHSEGRHGSVSKGHDGEIEMTIEEAELEDEEGAQANGPPAGLAGPAKSTKSGSGQRQSALPLRLAAAAQAGGFTYLSAGIDLAAREALRAGLWPVVEQAMKKGCRQTEDDFGGQCHLSEALGLKSAGGGNLTMVAASAGVGTKLKIAATMGKVETVGRDLVALCTNDVLAHGATPLFLTDYIACGKLEVSTVAGMTEGALTECEETGISFFMGERDEMPGLLPPGSFNYAGFCVGAVGSDQRLPLKEDLKEGDVLVGIPSSGVHANGYSLIRKILNSLGLTYEAPAPFDPSRSIGEVLLVPTRAYIKVLRPLMERKGADGKLMIKSLVPITAGGILGCLKKTLPEGVGARLDCTKWELPAVFRWMMKMGRVEPKEMAKTFNCGLGMLAVVSAADAPQVVEALRTEGDRDASIVGTLAPWKETDSTTNPALSAKRARIRIEHAETAWLQQDADPAMGRQSEGIPLDLVDPFAKRKVQVGVLVSGEGSNLQALIDSARREDFPAKIALVISNDPEAYGLVRARLADIPTVVVQHKMYKSRGEFESDLTKRLKEHNVELVCLAGWMRILTETFVDEWPSKILNVHPALLPSFPGLYPHQRVLDAGCRVAGCTVHYVTKGAVNTGPIIIQEAIAVGEDDSALTLSERVKVHCEWRAYPKALALVAEGKAPIVNGFVKISA